MRIAIGPNAFKGSLTAAEAAACIERGLRKALRGLSIVKLPMADGGDGTLLAIVAATGGQSVPCRVTDPLGRKMRPRFGLTGDGRTAVIEMALASGLALRKPQERNPLLTASRGTSELIGAALDRHVHEVIIGIGGSATNDGGMGLARALGVRLLDARNRELPDRGGALVRLARIDVSGRDARLKPTTISVACDVDNPLCGPRGAARVYGPQKGATLAMVKQLDAGLKRLAAVLQKDLGLKIANLPGAGAAGGVGAGLVALLNARMRPGVGMWSPSRLCDLARAGLVLAEDDAQFPSRSGALWFPSRLHRNYTRAIPRCRLVTLPAHHVLAGGDARPSRLPKRARQGRFDYMGTSINSVFHS